MTAITFLVVMIALLAIYYFPLRILGRLSKGARGYKSTGDAADLEKVASGVRGLAKFYGVFIIVILSVYAAGGVIFGIAFLALRSAAQ